SWDGSIGQFLAGNTADVRRRLLAIPGIGPETADSILLYAGQHPIFVVDAYTRRIFSRHGWCHPDADYATLQRICSVAAPTTLSQVDYYRDFHAQLVMIGKNFCRPRQPVCRECPLNCFALVNHPIS
ncbi:MAG: endonuclease III domain-containing protein, partial [Verrucomicrobia bacterium]|nr:endonuclease III domain-containing protein [Verrucomicrobiota bacterium]